jgi:hypothetical protein
VPTRDNLVLVEPPNLTALCLRSMHPRQSPARRRLARPAITALAFALAGALAGGCSGVERTPAAELAAVSRTQAADGTAEPATRKLQSSAVLTAIAKERVLGAEPGTIAGARGLPEQR